MKIIKPEIRELVQGTTCFEDILKHIEAVGRICYKSEDKIAPGSAEKFVNMLKTHRHGAMLEHGTIYLTVPEFNLRDDEGKVLEYQFIGLTHNKYTEVNYDIEGDGTAYITTNYRVIIENHYEDIMNKYIVFKPTKHHEKRRTFVLTCNRSTANEFVRHRVFSFAQESQRYVNYSKDKFGNEIKVIEPSALSFAEDKNILDYAIWKKACEEAEQSYMALLKYGATPQEARDVLPNACATELAMTGFTNDWCHFFSLRCAKDAHPQAQEVANMIKNIYYSNLNTGVSFNFCEQCPKFKARKNVALAQSDSVFDMSVDLQEFVLDCQKTCDKIGVNKDE